MVKIPRRAGTTEGARYLQELLAVHVGEQIAAFVRSQQYVTHKQITSNGSCLYRLHRHGREGLMVLVEVGHVKVAGGTIAIRMWVNGREVKRDEALPGMILAALDNEHGPDSE